MLAPDLDARGLDVRASTALGTRTLGTLGATATTCDLYPHVRADESRARVRDLVGKHSGKIHLPAAGGSTIVC